MINQNEKLPQTDINATLTFETSDEATDFATAYTRKTLMGYSIYKNTVKIWNVTDEIKEWITEYCDM